MLSQGATRRSVTADSNLVTEKIKHYVLTKQLEPGDPLPTELELCNELGVSRTSVREAIKTLSALHIVAVRHGHGTFVGDLSLEPLVDGLVFKSLLNGGDDLQLLRDLVDVRATLESSFTIRGLSALNQESLTLLSALVDEMDRKAEAGEQFFDEDRRFHEVLLSPHPNELARQLVAAFWDVAQRVVPLIGLPSDEDAHETVQRHRDLLTAVSTGRSDVVAAAVDRHFEPVRRRIALVVDQPERSVPNGSSGA